MYSPATLLGLTGSLPRTGTTFLFVMRTIGHRMRFESPEIQLTLREISDQNLEHFRKPRISKTHTRKTTPGDRKTAAAVRHRCIMRSASPHCNNRLRESSTQFDASLPPWTVCTPVDLGCRVETLVSLDWYQLVPLARCVLIYGE